MHLCQSKGITYSSGLRGPPGPLDQEDTREPRVEEDRKERLETREIKVLWDRQERAASKALWDL